MRTAILISCFILMLALTQAVPTATRMLPEYYVPGKEVTVLISADPGAEALAWVLEDSPPKGWQISQISAGGVWDTVNKKAKWGLFLDNKARDFSYTILPPSEESELVGFSGLLSVNGEGYEIKGGENLESAIELILRYLLGKEGGKAIDANGDEIVDISDVVFLTK